MWLLPWPISKVLPRSFRIYYFGPAGGPPPGFYDYWGTPGEYWPDMYTPPAPDSFPDLPAGPTNPSDPYTPGPGPVIPHPPVPSPGWVTCFDDTFWETKQNAVWNIDHWDFLGDYEVSIAPIEEGTWQVGYRPTRFRITHDYGPGLELIITTKLGGTVWAEDECVSGVSYAFHAWQGADLSGIEVDGGESGCDFDITNIEFFS